MIDNIIPFYYNGKYYNVFRNSSNISTEIDNDKNDSQPELHYTIATSSLRIIAALFFRLGYVLVQLGCIPVENVYVILFQNVLDISLSICCFGLLGFILAFGDDWGGFIGTNLWIGSEDLSISDAVRGFSTSLIGTAIYTTLLAGRIHFLACLIVTFFYTALVQPLIAHWMLSDNGWLNDWSVVGDEFTVNDYGGAITIHFASSLVGLIGIIVLGRRIIPLSDIHEFSIGIESPGSTFLGYFLIIIGLLLVTITYPKYNSTYPIGITLINGLMALSIGIIVMIILQLLIYQKIANYWSVLRCLQGAVAGLVSVSPGIDVYLPIISLAIAFVSTIIFFIFTLIINKTSIEDNCNIISIHLVCGLFGFLLEPLLGRGYSSLMPRFKQLAWHITATIVIFFFVGIIFCAIFIILRVTKKLRSKVEVKNHQLGAYVSKKLPRKRHFLKRLFTESTNTSYIEPGRK